MMGLKRVEIPKGAFPNKSTGVKICNINIHGIDKIFTARYDFCKNIFLSDYEKVHKLAKKQTSQNLSVLFS